MVNHGPDRSLILGISLDFNIIFPEITPKLLMLSNDSFRLCRCDFEQEPNGLVSGIRMMFWRDKCRYKIKFEHLSFGDVDILEQHFMHTWVPIFMAHIVANKVFFAGFMDKEHRTEHNVNFVSFSCGLGRHDSVNLFVWQVFVYFFDVVHVIWNDVVVDCTDRDIVVCCDACFEV